MYTDVCMCIEIDIYIYTPIHECFIRMFDPVSDTYLIRVPPLSLQDLVQKFRSQL